MEQLFRQYYPALCLYAADLLHDSDAAADTVQETFARLWRQGGPPAGLRNARAWLYAAVRHAALDRLAAEEVYGRRRQYGSHWSGTQPTPEEALVQAETLRRLAAAIATLPPQCRSVIELLYHEGLTPRQVADALHLHISTVKTQKQRGLAQLRKKLNNE